MRKSPFSTPGGSKRRQSYNWNTSDNANCTGYGYNKSDNFQYQSSNKCEANFQDDFIPLNISTPVSGNNRYSGGWYNNSGRNYHNSSDGGGNYRNNYSTPKSHFNNSYSPYKNFGSKQSYGPRKAYQKGAHRQVNISQYVDIESILEDPWADLLKEFNDSKCRSEKRKFTDENSVTANLFDLYSKQDTKFKTSVELNFRDPELSEDSKNESSTNITLDFDDTELSQVSKPDSSVDLNLSNIKFSQESKNESLCSSNDGHSSISDKA